MRSAGSVDIGIELLRPLLCFGVVCCHFWSSAPSFAWHFLLPCCAPLFFLISFFLFAERFTCIDGQVVRRRLFRLYFPLFSWAVIYYLTINLFHLLVKTGDLVSLKELVIQCVTGHCYNEPMWFQFDLIVVTFLFFIVAIACRNNMHYICIVFASLSFLAICLQYSGLNFRVFSSLDYSLQYPLGRLCEMLPYAFAGMVLPFIGNVKKWKRVLLVVLLLLCSVVLFYFHDSPQGFGYQGIRFLFLSVSAFVLVKLIDFGRLPDALKNAVLIVSKFTLGIYCAHLLIEKGIRLLVSCLSWESICGSFWYCIIVYFCCYLLFLCINRLFRNKYLKMIIQ